MVRSHILVCGGTGCTSSGSLKLIDTLNKDGTISNLLNPVAKIHNLMDKIKK